MQSLPSRRLCALAPVLLVLLGALLPLSAQCPSEAQVSFPSAHIYGRQYPPVGLGVTLVNQTYAFADQAILTAGSFAGAPTPPALAVDATGEPDTAPDPGCATLSAWPSGILATGHGGFVELFFAAGVELTNSGDARSDLHVFEGGAAFDDAFIALRAAPGSTATQAVLDALAPTSFAGSGPGGSFHVIGSLSQLRGLGQTFAMSIDLDGPASPLAGFPAGLLRFDAMMVLDDPMHCPPGSTCSGTLGQPGSGMTNEARPGVELDAVIILEATPMAPALAPTMNGVNPVLPRSDFYLCQTEVSLRGTGFLPPVSLTVGGVAVGTLQYVGPTEVRATIAPVQPGPGVHDVVLTCANGVVSALAAYTRTDVPTIDPSMGLAPRTGPTTGGGELTILGSGLIDVIGVDIGGVAATNVQGSADGTTVTCTVPPSATPGTAPVLVRMRCQSAMAPLNYEYVQATVLNSTLTIAANDPTYEGQHLLLRSSARVTIDGSHTFESLTMESGARIYATPAAMGATGPGLDLTISRDLVVASGAIIDMNGAGFGPDQGPGVSPEDLGSSHGGEGGIPTNVAGTVSSPAVYGSALAPVTFGSGGAVNAQSAGGWGGGAIRLQVAGTATVEGSIQANATGARASGGSIWLAANRLVGRTGSLTANGAREGANNTQDGGAGGRILVTSALGLDAWYSSTTAYGDDYAAPGTIVLRTGDPADDRALVVANTTHPSCRAFLPPLSSLDLLDVNAYGPVEMGSVADIERLQWTRGDLDRDGDLRVGRLIADNSTWSRLSVVGDLTIDVPERLDETLSLQVSGDLEFNDSVVWNRSGHSGSTVLDTTQVGGDLHVNGSLLFHVISSHVDLVMEVAGDATITGEFELTRSSSYDAGLHVGGQMTVGGSIDLDWWSTGLESRIEGGLVVAGDLRLREYVELMVGGVIQVAGNCELLDRARIEAIVAHGLTLNVEGDLDIAPAARITADSVNPVTRTGVFGHGFFGVDYAGGGAHGGNGGGYYLGGVRGFALAYGSPREPATFGGSGGVPLAGSVVSTARGGGALRLNIQGEIRHAGKITANGGTHSASGYGGGAGGSVWISCGAWTGFGTVEAHGGNGGGNGGCGGGGRIALHSASPIDPLHLGLSALSTNSGYFGGNGTIWLEDGSAGTPRLVYGWLGRAPTGVNTTAQRGVSRLDLDQFEALGVAPAEISIGAHSVVEVFRLGATATSTTPWTIAGDLTIDDTARLGVEPGQPLHIDCSGDLTIAVGAQILLDERGYPRDAGPGAGGFASDSGGGAGYGGFGGTGWVLTAGLMGPSGVSYGSVRAPVSLGSGGGTPPNAVGRMGGAGGGAARIEVDGVLDLSGRISANGGRGTGSSDFATGSGSGGSVWITASSVVGTGTIEANGGDYTTYVAAGGGGRIALEWPGAMTAIGPGGLTVRADGDNLSGAGTIYLDDAATANGCLIIDGGFTNQRSLAPTGVPSHEAYGDVILRNNARVLPDGPWSIAGNLSMERFAIISSNQLQRLEMHVGGDVDVDGTSTIDLRGLGWPGGTGPGAGLTVPLTGPNQSSYATGGGHGDAGASHGPVPGGGIYGSVLLPDTFGSGGGIPLRVATGTAARGMGGSGGGALLLDVTGDLFLEGRIDARGNDGTNASSTYWEYGGGGSGGSVLVRARILGGSGVIDLRGGGSSAGVGAAGRVAVYASRCGSLTRPTFFSGSSYVWQGGCTNVPSSPTGVLAALLEQRALGVSDAVVQLPAGAYPGFDLGSVFAGGAWPELRTLTIEGMGAGTIIDASVGAELLIQDVPAGVRVLLRDLAIMTAAGQPTTAVQIDRSEGLIVLEGVTIDAPDGTALAVATSPGEQGRVWLTNVGLTSGSIGVGLSSLDARLVLHRSTADRTSASAGSRLYLGQSSLGVLSGTPVIASSVPFTPLLTGARTVANSLTGGEMVRIEAVVAAAPCYVIVGFDDAWTEIAGLSSPLVADLFSVSSQLSPRMVADGVGNLDVPVLGSLTIQQLLPFLSGDSLVLQGAVEVGGQFFMTNPHFVRLAR